MLGCHCVELAGEFCVGRLVWGRGFEDAGRRCGLEMRVVVFEGRGFVVIVGGRKAGLACVLEEMEDG